MSMFIVVLGMVLFLIWPFFVGVLLSILVPKIFRWFSGLIGSVLWAGFNFWRFSEIERQSGNLNIYIVVIIEMGFAFLLATYGSSIVRKLKKRKGVRVPASTQGESSNIF